MKHIYLVFFLFVSACASIQPEQLTSQTILLRQQAWQHHQQQLDKVQGWHIKGRMAVTNGEEYWAISLDWQQFEDTYIIYLAGPFGAGNVKLVGSRNGVILTDSDNNSFFAKDPDTLLFQQTGVTLPVASMRYWVLGLPEPDQTLGQKSVQIQKHQFDAMGRLENLDRQPWLIQYKRYTQIDGIAVPEKIFLANGEDIELRMVIGNWELTQQVASNEKAAMY